MNRTILPWLPAEVLLVATMLATTNILGRLFLAGSNLTPVYFTVVVGHAALAVLRRLEFPAVVGVGASFLAVILAITATHYPDAAVVSLIPTTATADAFGVDLSAAQATFETVKAPVPALTGFLIVSSLAIWILGAAADWSAFRLRAPAQAVVPTLAVLVFVSILGVQDGRVRTTAILIIAAIGFILAHRAADQAMSGTWIATTLSRRYWSLLGIGAALAGIGVAAGLAFGPDLPGADDPPIIDIDNRGTRPADPIEVISPLVQIQPRLVDQRNDVMFTVDSPRPAYWRIAALDTFDGSLWRSQGKYRRADDDLDTTVPSLSTEIVEHRVQITSLNAVWAPAAYLPIQVETLSDIGMSFEADSATFIVDTGSQANSNGLEYRVTSAIPQPSADELRSLSTGAHRPDDRYLDLPVGFSPTTQRVAREITDGLGTDYDKALALQFFFQDNFIYDLNVGNGHHIERIEDFLEVRRGYCEQFAGTFAAMARSIGIPARVATGFTPGETTTENPNRYTVRGSHAHAWPEVWLGDAGWVAFEPTPGRGAPNSGYTGLAAQQDEQQTEAAAETEQAAEPVPAGAAPTPTPDQNFEFEAEPTPASEPSAETVVTETTGEGSTRWTWLLALALGLAWILGVPAAKRMRDRARARTAPRHRVTTAWARTVDTLSSRELGPEPGETAIEFARRVEWAQPSVEPSLSRLASIVTSATHSKADPSPDAAARAEADATAVIDGIRALDPFVVRLARDVDPRPLLRWPDPVAVSADRLADGAVDQEPSVGAGV